MDFFDKRLSNVDIIGIADRLNLPLRGVYMKDTLPKKLTNGYYVLNLDDVKGSGTHWTVFAKIGQEICYFDSFGQLPPDQVFKQMLKFKKAYYSDKIVQDTKSNMCGFYAIFFMIFFETHKGTPFDLLEQFHDVFFDNGKVLSNAMGKKNDTVVREVLTKYLSG